ncbi:hypothetical protein FJD34_10670 [Pseudomonas brenneri]|uniref:Uncharacterized protein n=1 Tax=Pseudomonas brenneri TaxID=129817 RepID=A0A5B2UZ81_9PSED|nr:hypothetical protein F1720_06915 [Pseudomonas brenneri]TWR79418.1 hypothetical protein FJD34_10670 [Pseudomonas brenneri]
MEGDLDGHGFPFVGASLLAKNSRAPRLIWFYALSLTFFASKLAPTGERRFEDVIRGRYRRRRSTSSGSARKYHQPGWQQCPC